jgi:tetratricopeptide (TPR) repeat protein
LNHLNYVAYFNLFSLEYRAGQEETAFDNLCCSLSCLYLLRAKKSRRELDVQRAINYADNNFEAYILKSLMYLEDGRLKPALNNIEWALDINPGSLVSQRLKNVISKKIDPYAPGDLLAQT